MKTAFVVVDGQITFCECGNLAVAGGTAACAACTAHLEAHGDDYDVVAVTRDWHIDPGDHFAPEGTEPDPPNNWPPHGEADTEDAEFHPALDLSYADVIISKGQYSAAYSGCEGTAEDREVLTALQTARRTPARRLLNLVGNTLVTILRAAGVTRVVVGGIALDFCVKATALDLRAAGFEVIVLVDLTASVSDATAAAAIAEMEAAGIVVTTSAALAA